MRRVRGAGREVDEERFVGHERLLLAHPGDGPVRQVFRERVAFLRRARRLDRRRALVEARIVLIGFAADEPVEVFESGARWPLRERADRRDFPDRDFVALSELSGRVSVQFERLGQRRFVLRTHAAVARSRRRHLGNRTHAHRMMVAAGEERLARRRAERGRMKAIVFQAALRQALGVGRAAGPAEG